MTHADDYASQALEALKQAVAEALERKRRLGQYAVVWRNGRATCIGPDAPAGNNPYAMDSEPAPHAVAEPRTEG